MKNSDIKKNKAAFAKSKQKYLDRMDKIEDSSSDTSQMKAVFTCARKGGKQVLDVEDLRLVMIKCCLMCPFNYCKDNVWPLLDLMELVNQL